VLVDHFLNAVPGDDAVHGRIAKTLHLLAMVDPVDETYRRAVTRQLNIGESRPSRALASTSDDCRGRVEKGTVDLTAPLCCRRLDKERCR
jgi:hypothetical protein